MNKFLLYLLATFLFQSKCFGQDLWRIKVDNQQKVLCNKAQRNNCILNISSNPEVNLVATSFIIQKVDYWQNYIDSIKPLSKNERITIYRVLENQLIKFNSYAKNRLKEKDFKASLAQELFQNFDKTIEAYRKNITLDQVIEPLGYLASKIIVEDPFASVTLGLEEAKTLLILKDCSEHHDKILSILSNKTNFKYADSLIQIAAFENQDKIYNLAQCTSCPLYNKLKNHPNTLVQTLFKMAQMESGRALTPFLDMISRNEITIDSINKIQAFPDQYFKLLVNTRQKLLQRIAAKNEILALNNFNSKISDIANGFVHQINEAHNLPDNIRFAPLRNLNPAELYYIAVYGINDLYTSSFIRGVFAQLITKLNGTGTDKLLQQLNFDYFRKFIKISAGYSKLAQFLKLMPDSSAQTIMHNFISDLINNNDLNDIEDAVDVADAYGGIGNNPELNTVRTQILDEVKTLYNFYKTEGDQKGETIYRLFDIIFNSFQDTSINLSAQLGLPSITKVEYNALAKTENKTIVKVYFYSDEDKDGQNSYVHFLSFFNDKTLWKIEQNPNFVIISTKKGKPIQIFANKPLYDPTKSKDLADTTKLRMSDYVKKLGMQPTFIVHRGHSYHVPISLKYIEQYDTAAKIIILGSCGSYQNLVKALEITPDAHIITSKQTGSMRVNDPLLQATLKDINSGKNIVWPELWPRLKNLIGGGDAGEMFSEYLPPHLNLGMIFIKSYKKQIE